MSETILTVQGYQKMQMEIEHIKTTMMPDVSKRLEIADQLGDEEAIKNITEEFDFYTQRIPFLENVLSTAKVVKSNDEKKAEELLKEFNRNHEFIGHTANEIFQLGMQQALETAGIKLPWTRLK